MLGKDDHPGIMAHAITELFVEMRRTTDDHVYKVTMSYLEVRSPPLLRLRLKSTACGWTPWADVLHDVVLSFLGLKHDTIYLRALKSWRYGQFNLAHGTETKNKEKLQTETE